MSFQYHRPTNWEQAIDLLSQTGAIAKMGGCDVLTRYRCGKLVARSVIALNALPGIGGIEHSPAGARIGAAVTLTELSADSEFRHCWPTIARIAGNIASPAIRNVASVVGNIAQDWSISDLVPLFAVCDAQLNVRGPSGNRDLLLTIYAEQPRREALRQGEIIASLALPAASAGLRISYERFSFREAFDLPLVAVAIGTSAQGSELENVRVAVTGAGRLPVRCAPVEAILKNSTNDDATCERAMSAIAGWAEPESDFQASADYRRHVLQFTLKNALSALRHH